MKKTRRYQRKWVRHQLRIRLFSQELDRFRRQLGQVSREKVRKLNCLIDRMNRLWPGESGL